VATHRRVAQILGDDLPARRPQAAVVIMSTVGLIAAFRGDGQRGSRPRMRQAA